MTLKSTTRDMQLNVRGSAPCGFYRTEWESFSHICSLAFLFFFLFLALPSCQAKTQLSNVPGICFTMCQTPHHSHPRGLTLHIKPRQVDVYRPVSLEVEVVGLYPYFPSRATSVLI